MNFSMPFMTGHVIVETFHRGGPIMWPMLAVFLLAQVVLIDRLRWWWAASRQMDVSRRERVLALLASGQAAQVQQTAQGSRDPLLCMLMEAMNYPVKTQSAVMACAAQLWIEESQRRLWILSTVITLAPLLGLLGTVVGIMASFDVIGTDQLAVTKVSGGIAEALIATAFGLGIAIFSLLPFNAMRRRSAQLRSQAEQWINRVELQQSLATESTTAP